MEDRRTIPVSVLTGFLGAGKTTLLNYILKEQSKYKFAVIVNEIGQVGIDGQLVENQKDELLEMSNGCICCTIRKDLVKGVQKLLKKGGFDYLLVETTGIAEPGPVAQTFLNIPQLQQFVRLDSIITVVDAEQILHQLEETETVREQIALGDFIVLNKIDLVTAEHLTMVEAIIHKLNPHASVFHSEQSKVNLGEMLDMHAFDVDRKLEIAPRFLDEMAHRHHDDIQSFAFIFDRPFRQEALEDAIQKMSLSEKIYRSKGIIWLEGTPRRAVFHGVNNRFSLFWDRLWQKEETRKSQLVFIGRDLDEAKIRTALQQCL